MKRIARLSSIVAVVVVTLLPGVGAVAQDEWTEDEEFEDSELVTLLSLRRHVVEERISDMPQDVVSPFSDTWDGDRGEFGVTGVVRVGAESALGSQRPFTEPHFADNFTSHLPATNDYFVNSPYTVAITVEVTVPVSGCGSNEYREAALFLTRPGLPTIGENPDVPNDPGVGATEAVALVCTGGVSSTVYLIPEAGVPKPYAPPYPIVETTLGNRHFVTFIIADPFAAARVVGSFATDISDQSQVGFVVGDLEQEDVIVAAEDLVLTSDDIVLFSQLVQTGADPVAPAEPGDAADEDPAAPDTGNDSSGDELAADEAGGDQSQGDQAEGELPPAANPAPAEQEPSQDVAQQEPDEGGGSALPVIFGGIVGGAIVFGGVVLYRKRHVKLRGHGIPMLSDAEEARAAGESAGLPEDRGWQQIPWSVGQSFGQRGGGGTKRENVLGKERQTKVDLLELPWQWEDASKRGLRMDKHFAYWIKDGVLQVGTPENPYAFDSLLDTSEYPVDVSPSDYERVDEPEQPWNRKVEGTPLSMDDNDIPPA